MTARPVFARGGERIEAVRAREIIDSRGNPTVEADVRLAGGAVGSAAVPSGASTGAREAVELRDADPGRFAGRGVERAVSNVEREISPALAGEEAGEQARIDRRLCELDGTANKARLGANAILAVSLATARAAAAARGQWLYEHLAALAGRPPPKMPVPMMNVVNGGAHADNNVDVQEFMVVPCGAPSFREAVRWGAEVFHALKALLREGGRATAVGDEGGVAPDLDSNREAIELILRAVVRAGYRPGRDVCIAIDAASSEFHRTAATVSRAGRSTLPASLPSSAPGRTTSRSSPSRTAWRRTTGRVGRSSPPGSGIGYSSSVTTSSSPIRRFSGEGYGKEWRTRCSSRSTRSAPSRRPSTPSPSRVKRDTRRSSPPLGETEDTFIADLAVATGAGQIKTGSMCRSDRVSKYNRLLRIEERLEEAAWPGPKVFAGRAATPA